MWDFYVHTFFIIFFAEFWNKQFIVQKLLLILFKFKSSNSIISIILIKKLTFMYYPHIHITFSDSNFWRLHHIAKLNFDPIWPYISTALVVKITSPKGQGIRVLWNLIFALTSSYLRSYLYLSCNWLFSTSTSDSLQNGYKTTQFCFIYVCLVGNVLFQEYNELLYGVALLFRGSCLTLALSCL